MRRGRGGIPGRGWLIGATLVLLLSLVATVGVPGAGAALQVRIAAEASFDGTYRPGEWLPIAVALANDGATVTGQVVVEASQSGGTARYVQRVELPSGAQKALTIYARVESGTGLDVYFEAGKERADAPRIVLRATRGSQQVVGVIADDATVAEELRRALIGAYGTTRIEVATFPPDEVPGNTYGLGIFSGLVIGDATTGRWSAEQRAALAAWIARGGRLVVSGGANARKVAEGLGDLPPLRPRDSRAVNGLSGLGATGPAGPAVVATGDLIPEATRQREQDGQPLVAARPWGRGVVTSLAFDPATGGFANWSGAGSFWTGFALDTALPASLQQPFDRGASASYPYGPQSARIATVLNDLPGLALPPTWLLGIVLLVFIVLIGPGNYLILQRLDRRELAWVTIPALTILFALGIYAVGATTKGRSVIVSSVSIVRIAPEARAAEVQAFYGVFTPSRGRRDFGVSGDALFTGFTGQGLGEQGDLGGDVRFEQGGNGGVRAASFAQWTQRTVAAQGMVDPAPLALRAELRWEGAKLVGTITNTSNRAIDDALLVYNNAYFRVGNLAPGGSAQVAWSPSPGSGVAPSPYYRAGLGSAVYPGASLSYPGAQPSKSLGVDGRRAEVLDALSGTVLAYSAGSGPTYGPPPTPTPRATATATPRATPAPSGGAGATTGGARAGSGPVQLLYWRGDAPLELKINAGERNATTLIIQELLPATVTQQGPGGAIAAGGGR